MATVVDDAGDLIVVVRTIDVTPEPPDPAGPSQFDEQAGATDTATLARRITVAFTDTSADTDTASPATRRSVQDSAGAGDAATVQLELAAPAVAVTVGFDAHGTQPILPGVAVAVTVRAHGRITGDVDTVDGVPIAVTVRVPAAVAVDSPGVLAVEPIAVAVALHPLPVEAGIYLTQPGENEVLPNSYPDFIVGLDQKDEDLGYVIEIQYADNSAFTGAVTITDTPEGTQGGSVLSAVTPVPAAGFWRARLLLDGVVQIDWSEPNQFSVDTASSTTTIAVAWSASTALSPAIHLWHFDPDGPLVGDTVTAYGQGFPLSPGTLRLSGVSVPVVSWVLVAANTSTFTGVIAGSTADPEHFEVTFIAPQVDPPGGPFSVEA